MATFTAGVFGVDFDLLNLAPLASVASADGSSASVTLSADGISVLLSGTGLQIPAVGPPTAGLIQRITVNGGGAYDISGLSLSAETFRGWVMAGDNAAARASIFAGADSINGSSFDDRLLGFAGADTINGRDGADTLNGGDGVSYLRGDSGDDYISGGVDFDDINGNMGNDTAQGGVGDDWVVGGRDNDVLFGDDGNDLVYGNLGDDFCDGGAGADTIRGGQGTDSLTGGAGNDFVSGDRGDDTMMGGLGADLFHSSADAGLDRVLDFSVSQGDRVQLDPGTTFTFGQVGADTVISLSGGQVVLVGVSMSSLLATSIFGA